MTLTATRGALDVATVSGVTVTGAGTGTVVLSGQFADLNLALAGLIFTPEKNYFGAASIQVLTSDNGNTGGPAETAEDTIAITINGVNDAPVLGDYTFYLSGTVSAGTVVGTVTATDVENDTIAYAVTAGDPDSHFSIDPVSGRITVADPSNLAQSYTLTVMATDNGSPNASDTGTVTVIRNSAPTTGGIPTQTVNEDAAPIALTLSDDFADDEQLADTLVYSITGNTNAALFQSVSLQGTGLVMTLTPNAFGAVDITVMATDVGGLFAETTFTVTVNAVNDAPTVDPLTDLSVAEDAAEQTVSLSGISAGPANESGQSLTITVTSNNPALFADPTVEYTGGTTGTLKFTPTPEAYGTATVTVTVTDDGGTANNGVNVVVRTFTVTVGAVNDRPQIDTSFTPMLPPIPKALKAGELSPATPVGTLLGHASDVDGNDLGIAIVAADATGKWEYSTSGGASWALFPGTVSEASPLYLADDGQTQIRFTPNKRGPGVKPFAKGFAGLSYRAWDGTDTSAELERAWVAVGKTTPGVDDNGQPVLKEIREDVRQSPAYPVGTAGDGTWEFNTGKDGWRPIGTVSDTAALLLRPTDRVRFKPAQDFDGEATLTYHTWDQAAGAFGTKVDSGTATGVGSATETAVLDVLPVNDRPVVGGTIDLGQVGAGQFTTGQTVAAFLGGTATDVDSPALGVQLLPASKRLGTWQYEDGAGNWVDAKRATVLAPGVQIRFAAAAGAKAGTYTLKFKAWDQTSPPRDGPVQGGHVDGGSDGVRQSGEGATAGRWCFLAGRFSNRSDVVDGLQSGESARRRRSTRGEASVPLADAAAALRPWTAVNRSPDGPAADRSRRLNSLDFFTASTPVPRGPPVQWGNQRGGCRVQRTGHFGPPPRQ